MNGSGLCARCPIKTRLRELGIVPKRDPRIEFESDNKDEGDGYSLRNICELWKWCHTKLAHRGVDDHDKIVTDFFRARNSDIVDVTGQRRRKAVIRSTTILPILKFQAKVDTLSDMGEAQDKGRGLA